VADPCPVCPILQREADWLRKQVEQLQTQIVNLSDPLALARVKATEARPARPAIDKPKSHVKDALDQGEVDRILAAEQPNPEPPVVQTHGEIEASFVKAG
jgi:hypothetical protein